MGSWEGQGQRKQEHPSGHHCEGSQEDSLSHQPQGDDVIHGERARDCTALFTQSVGPSGIPGLLLS